MGAMSQPGPRSLRRIAADLAGALNGAASSLAITVAAATLVFAPLGAEWLPAALVACLACAIVGGLVAAIFSSSRVTISSPRAAVSIVVASLVATLHGEMPTLGPVATVALALVAVMLAGAMQAIGGALRLGQLVRFVPFPVIAGFTHGIALALVVIYVPVFLGMAELPRLVWPRGMAIDPGSVVVGGMTLAATMICARPRWRLPALFVGLAAGTSLHAALSIAAPHLAAGAVLPLTALPLPQSPLAEPSLSTLLTQPAVWRLLVSFALAIAVVASVDSLIGAMAVETRSGMRSNPNRDLAAQGLGNIASALSGGVATSYSAVQVLSALGAGATGRLATYATPLLVLALAAAGTYLCDGIPMPVVAALMLFVAGRLADPWGFALLRLARKAETRRDPVVRNSLIVYVLVALSIVLLDVVTALVVGMTVAAVIFLRTVNQHLVRRVVSGPAVRSRRLFPPGPTEAIARGMECVTVIELQGPLFFGTADRIVEEVHRLPSSVRFVVLDLWRVQALDETAVAVVSRLAARMRLERREFVVSGRPPGLLAMDASLPRAFADRDRAIEWIEERLLDEARMPDALDAIRPAAVADLLALEPAERQVLDRESRVESHPPGHRLFRAGDASDALYFLLEGRVSIVHDAPGESMRIVTFLPGNIFGDVAFVDGKPRSADAICDTVSRLLVLDRAALARIGQDAPSVVVRLYALLAQNIAGRLRAADRIIREVV